MEVEFGGGEIRGPPIFTKLEILKWEYGLGIILGWRFPKGEETPGKIGGRPKIGSLKIWGIRYPHLGLQEKGRFLKPPIFEPLFGMGTPIRAKKGGCEKKPPKHRGCGPLSKGTSLY